MLDAQQKVDAVNALQKKLVPLASRLDALDAGLEQAAARFRKRSATKRRSPSSRRG